MQHLGIGVDLCENNVRCLGNVIALGMLGDMYCLLFYHNSTFNTAMQQSAAFKILKTRLKAVPSYSFNSDQFKRTLSGSPYQILNQVTEDGDVTFEGGKSHNGINFAARLQQFEKMQYQHRVHAKAQAQWRNNSMSLSKVVDLFVLSSMYFFFSTYNLKGANEEYQEARVFERKPYWCWTCIHLRCICMCVPVYIWFLNIPVPESVLYLLPRKSQRGRWGLSSFYRCYVLAHVLFCACLFALPVFWYHYLHFMQGSQPQRLEEPRRTQSSDLNAPPSRSSMKAPGQLQL